MPQKSHSPGKRSRTGCMTCRERKLKCDEKRPVCGHCAKANRRCQPSSGIVFRHHQNPSMNAHLKPGEKEDLDSFYAYKDTFTDENTWLPIRGALKFINIIDPFAEDDATLDVDQMEVSPVIKPTAGVVPQTAIVATVHPLSSLRDEPLSATPASATFTRPSTSGARALPNFASFERPPRNRSISTLAPTASSPASTVPSRTIPSPLSPFSVAEPPQSATSYHDSGYRFPGLSGTASPQPWLSASPARSYPSTPRPALPLSSPVPFESDPEVLFLLRHFATGVGFSMDLFDCGRFFSDYVPTRAMYNPLLKNACCAYAAKQLAMVGGSRMTGGVGRSVGLWSRPALTECWPNPEQTDWMKIATKYYDEAIHLLLQAVDLVNKDKGAGAEWQEGMTQAGKSDDLMAATAILCEVEAIDSSGEAWQRHLNGTKSLLDIAEAGMRPLDEIEIKDRKPRFSRARRAIFWNFARQDFAAALITESPARLDVNNHQLWRDAGLELDRFGRIESKPGMWIEYSEGALAMREDMISNALILILSKICNYLSNAESLVPPPVGISARHVNQYDENVPCYGLSQQYLLERWALLSEEVGEWHKNLPGTFKPIGRCRSGARNFEEIWYGIGMCGASMANYHMARILLLINKPQESTMTRSTVSSRMGEYRSIVPECEWHGREIVGIALARPETAVRIFLILPLFFAGQCFTSFEERKTVVEVLRGIEKDLGWATEYRVTALLKAWGYDESMVRDTTIHPSRDHRSPSEMRV